MKKILYASLFLFIVILAHTASADYNTPEKGLLVSIEQTIPTPVQPNDKNVLLILEITHLGSRTYKNVSIKAEFQSPLKPVKKEYNISRIDPHDKYTVALRFDVENTDPGVYVVPIDIKYIDTYADYNIEYTRYVYVQVSTNPKLEFTSITGQEAVIGNDFEIGFGVKNTGFLPATEIIASIKINSSSYITWIPDKTTLTGLSPGESAIIYFKGRTSKDTKPGTYMGTVTLEYSGLSLSNSFAMSITGEPRLSIAGVSTDDSLTVGKNMILSVQFDNIGEGDAKSVKATIKTDNFKGVKESYVGSIEKDDTGTAIFELIPMKEGEIRVPITVTYSNSNNKNYSKEYSISLYVSKKPFNTAPYLLLLLLAGAVFYYYKRKKVKKELAKGI